MISVLSDITEISQYISSMYKQQQSIQDAGTGLNNNNQEQINTNEKRQDFCNLSVCSSTTQILADETNWVSPFTNQNNNQIAHQYSNNNHSNNIHSNNSIILTNSTHNNFSDKDTSFQKTNRLLSTSNSMVSDQNISENLRCVQYQFSPIPPPSHKQLLQSELSYKLLLSNIFMNINLSPQTSVQGRNKQLINQNSLILTSGEINKKEYFYSLSDLHCISVETFKKNKVISIKFSSEKEKSKQSSFKEGVQDQLFQPHNPSSEINQNNQFLQESSNQLPSDQLLNYSQQNQFNLKNNNNYNLLVFSDSQQNSEMEIENNKEEKMKQQLQETMQWIQEKMQTPSPLKKIKKCSIRNTGSTFYLFAFDEKNKKYRLSNQLMSQSFHSLVHYSQDEIAFSYLHLSEKLKQSPNNSGINQYMENIFENALPIFEQEQNHLTELNNSTESSNKIVSSINIKDYETVCSGDQVVLIDENLHFISFKDLETVSLKQEKSIQFTSTFVILEQSYFYSMNKKSGLNHDGSQIEKSNSAILKQYHNAIKKIPPHRHSLIDSHYLQQSLSFQQKFYAKKIEWKRRGKNQKQKQKNCFDEESSSSSCLSSQ